LLDTATLRILPSARSAREVHTLVPRVQSLKSRRTLHTAHHRPGETMPAGDGSLRGRINPLPLSAGGERILQRQKLLSLQTTNASSAQSAGTARPDPPPGGVSRTRRSTCPPRGRS
jgi:hypothetical protein